MIKDISERINLALNEHDFRIGYMKQLARIKEENMELDFNPVKYFWRQYNQKDSLKYVTEGYERKLRRKYTSAYVQTILKYNDLITK